MAETPDPVQLERADLKMTFFQLDKIATVTTPLDKIGGHLVQRIATKFTDFKNDRDAVVAVIDRLLENFKGLNARLTKFNKSHEIDEVTLVTCVRRSKALLDAGIQFNAENGRTNANFIAYNKANVEYKAMHELIGPTAREALRCVARSTTLANNDSK